MQNINNYNQNVQTAIDLYKNNMAQQDVAKNQAMANMNVALRANGMAGTGASESSLIGLQNAYMGNINQANANLQNNINAYNQQYDENQALARQLYNQDMDTVEANKSNARSKMYNIITQTDSVEDLDAVLKMYKDEYGEDIMNNAALQYVINARRQQLSDVDTLTTKDTANYALVATKYGIEVNDKDNPTEITAKGIDQNAFYLDFPELADVDLKDGQIVKADFDDKVNRNFGGKKAKEDGVREKEYYVYLNGKFYLYKGTGEKPTGAMYRRVKYKVKNSGKVKNRNK